MTNFKTQGDSERHMVEKHVRRTKEREDRVGANKEEVQNGGGPGTGSVSGPGRGERKSEFFARYYPARAMRGWYSTTSMGSPVVAYYSVNL